MKSSRQNVGMENRVGRQASPNDDNEQPHKVWLLASHATIATLHTPNTATRRYFNLWVENDGASQIRNIYSWIPPRGSQFKLQAKLRN